MLLSLLQLDPMNESKSEEGCRSPSQKDELEEMVHADDAVIGHAIKWSAFAALFLVIVACLMFVTFHFSTGAHLKRQIGDVRADGHGEN